MTYEHKDMSGSAFSNRKKSEPTHADLTGDGRIFGKDVWINVWKKKDKNGDTWISFSFREKAPKGDNARPAQASVKIADDTDLPF